MYTLNEKIRDLEPYEPLKGEFNIRLDANESFLPLPEEIKEKAMCAVGNVALNQLTTYLYGFT